MTAKTYLLQDVSTPLLARIRSTAIRIESHMDRAIVYTTVPPPAGMIMRVFSGDQVEHLRSWISRSILDVLHEEFLERSPVPAQKQKAAIRAWKKVRRDRLIAEQRLNRGYERWKKERKRLEDRIALSKQRETETSKELVRTHGRVPVLVDGMLWDVSYSKNTVFFIPRAQETAGKKSSRNGSPRRS
jgi:hypothetical protein